MTFGSRLPWQTLHESEVFAIDPPEEGGDRHYCSVLGGGGEVFRLMMFEGDAGYRLHHRLQMAKPIDRVTLLTSANILYVEYVRIGELKPPDKAVLRAFDITLAPNQLFPIFRSIRRGSTEWYVSSRESRILSEGLLAGLVVFGEVTVNSGANADLWHDPKKVPLIRVIKGVAGKYRPDVSMVRLPATRGVAPAPLKPAPLPEPRELKKLKSEAGDQGAGGEQWELDRFFLPSLIGARGERARLIAVAMAADAATGFACPPTIGEYSDDPGEALASALLSAIRTFRRIPGKLYVAGVAIEKCLAPLTAALGIPVEVKKALPAIAACRQSMINHSF